MADVRSLLTSAEQTDRLSDQQLRAAAEALRPAIRKEGFTKSLVLESYSLVSAAVVRKLGIRYHAVQLVGGLGLLDGMLIEMATGEGKTVTAALAATTAALAGMPVHVITVNDYLAARDAALLKPVYATLGLSVGCVQQGDDASARRAAYAADITYVANKEVGFDYLRDHLARQRRAGARVINSNAISDDLQPVLRGLGYAIVDEADSVLIDEARTPLIIAEPSTDTDFDYAAALNVARSLRCDDDYRLDAARRTAELSETGRATLADRANALSGVWRHRRAREEIAEQALAALHLFERDRHYIVRSGKVEIIDEYTGRVAEGRQWERGLHQLIEAKENAEPSARNRTAARITYQSFFRRYVRLSGMSGTAAEHYTEFLTVYGVRVIRIPTDRPVKRRCIGRSIYATGAGRWDAVAEAAKREYSRGRPVLIGTRSVLASEAASAALKARGLPHTVLNARQDQHEAETVAAAGQESRITVATNMAGRGTDIKLAPEVARRGGLHVIVTEFHESARIDRQLIGRCARQGDPGTWEAIVSLEDELFHAHARLLCGAFRSWPARVTLELLRRQAQLVAETRHARSRRMLLATERTAQRMFAFAGEGVWL